MRIRWTTRIATAMGVLTLIIGIAVGGGGTANAAPDRPATPSSASHSPATAP